MAEEHRKPGPKTFLENIVKFSTQLTQEHYDKLEVYCQKHRISKAEAIRRAVDLLVDADT